MAFNWTPDGSCIHRWLAPVVGLLLQKGADSIRPVANRISRASYSIGCRASSTPRAVCVYVGCVRVFGSLGLRDVCKSGKSHDVRSIARLANWTHRHCSEKGRHTSQQIRPSSIQFVCFGSARFSSVRFDSIRFRGLDSTYRVSRLTIAILSPLECDQRFCAAVVFAYYILYTNATACAARTASN